MRKLTVGFLNVRSLSLHLSDVKNFLFREQYDILGVSETWLNPNIEDDKLKIKGYNFVREDRLSNRAGGVGVYLKNNLSFKIIHKAIVDDLEEMWIEVKLFKSIYVFGSLYRPPKGNILEFINLIETRLADFTGFEVVCGGDINIDLLDSTGSNANNFLDIIDALNLKQIITEPTRYSALLDIIIVSKQEENLEQGNKVVSHISDHELVYCKFKNKNSRSEDKIKCRNFKNIDRDLLSEFLELAQFENIIYLQNINQKVNHLNEILLNIFDVLAPMKEFQIRNKKPGWLTGTIRTMMGIKDRAYKRYKHNKTETNWSSFKNIRNQTNIAIRTEKKSYLEYCLNNTINNSKALWAKLRELDVYSKKSVNILPELLNKPNEINQHFLQFSTINSTPNRHTLEFYKNNLKTIFASLFDFYTVSENVIKECLLEIKSLAVGADKINLDMILLSCPRILPFITNIINSCLLEHCFPDSWKVSRIIPVPKKVDATSYGDLRPINILPVLSKVLEKIMCRQIQEHLNKYKILPERQSGFRTGYSCTTALLNITDDIIRATDTGKTTALVLLDFSKAFDRMNHELLTAILHYVGFGDHAITLMRSYLYNRFQFTETTGGVSCAGVMACGVPQGSILGPILFSIYTCNLATCIQNCNIHLYADDTQLYLSFLPETKDIAEANINADIKRLIKFSESHCLELNVDKSHLLVFGKQKDLIGDSLNISINNDIIGRTETARNLGLTFDTSLRFKPHVNNCIRKAYASLKMLFPHRHILSQQLKIKITDSIVLSHFNYCDVVYGPCLDSVDINRIQKVQKSCLRFIYGIRKYEPVSFKMNDAHWVKMEKRRQVHAIVLFHRIIFNKCPPYLLYKIKFRTDVHSLNLRYRGYISPPAHKTTFFQRSFSYQIYILYNSVPDMFKLLPPNSFKRQYKFGSDLLQ